MFTTIFNTSSVQLLLCPLRVVIEQAVKRDSQEKTLYQTAFTSPAGEPTYMAYSTLLERNKEAHDGLRLAMVTAADTVYKSMFVPAE